VALRHRGLAGVAFFVVLTVAHTWPLATAPGVLSRNDNADTMLNEWILAWIAHALPRDPLALFQANIFHPEPHALAFSEHLFVPGLMAAPLLWAGASPVLAHNLVLLAGMVLTGWTTSLVLARWTGSAGAGLVAGSIAIFNTHTLTRIAHVQAMHLAFLPLALLALDEVLARPRMRHALALAAWFTLQALCSGYMLVLTAVALACGALARVGEWVGRHRARQILPLLLLAAGVAGLACLPFLLPYAAVRTEQGLTRSLAEVASYSADWRDWLTTAGRLHFAAWSHRFYDSTDALFPGVVPLMLASVAIGSGAALRDPRARMLLVIAVAGFALSFGPAFPPYAWLYEALPLLQGIRGAARFGYLTIFAVAGLAAYGLARLQRRAGPGRHGAIVLAVLCLVAVNAESWRAPIGLVRFEGIPAIYDRLAGERHAVVAEMPFPHPDRVADNAPYVLASTRHFHPLVNGYSGFTPQGYVRRAAALADFPDDRSIGELQRLGVTHVVVHDERDPMLAARAAQWPQLQPFVEERGLRIYRLDPAEGRQSTDP
jgi:hypothetical protein